MGLLSALDNRRRTIRAPVNPLDKSTIVSIFPKEIDEVKHTIQPGRFVIPPGSFEKPAILVVGPSSWWRDVNEDEPLLEIPNSSIQVADSVVKDWMSGLFGCAMGVAQPGVFYIHGEVSLVNLVTKHRAEMELARTRQKAWYENLVKLTDGLWARTNGNPLVVSDDARLAARELNLNNKDWMKDFTAINQERCPACGNLRNPEFPICQSCHTIVDPKKFKDLGLQQMEAK